MVVRGNGGRGRQWRRKGQFSCRRKGGGIGDLASGRKGVCALLAARGGEQYLMLGRSQAGKKMEDSLRNQGCSPGCLGRPGGHGCLGRPPPPPPSSSCLPPLHWQPRFRCPHPTFSVLCSLFSVLCPAVSFCSLVCMTSCCNWLRPLNKKKTCRRLRHNEEKN